MRIRAVIAEDEAIVRAELAAALAVACPEMEIVAACANGIDAVDAALLFRPDVLFLDIKMPGLSGLEAAEDLADAWPQAAAFPLLVFVTAYQDYAIAAFDRAAADYILKPVDERRLARTVERLRSRLKGPAPDDDIARLSQLVQALAARPTGSDYLTHVRASVGNGVRLIPIEDVLYFETGGHYINVVTETASALIRMSLRELTDRLDPKHFWQIHRTTVVNVRYMHQATRDETGKWTLTLSKRPEKLRVSPVYAHLFRQM